MLDNVLVGKFFNKKYDMNLLHKKDKQLGQSKKLGKVKKGVMKNDETGSFKQYLIEIFGDFGQKICCCCLRPSANDKIFQLAR